MSRISASERKMIKEIAKELIPIHIDEVISFEGVGGEERRNLAIEHGGEIDGIDDDKVYPIPVVSKVSKKWRRIYTELMGEFKAHRIEGVKLYIQKHNEEVDRAMQVFPHYYEEYFKDNDDKDSK